MEVAVAIIGFVSFGGAAVWAYTKLIAKLSAGFTKMESKQDELSDDLAELKGELAVNRDEINEIKLDVAHMRGAAQIPPRIKR